MKDETKKEQHNGRDLKSKDRKSHARSPSRRERSRSPVERRSKDSTKAQRRVYFANVSFDTRWTEIKDLFRDKIGNVAYCKLFEEGGRSRGCGLIEFHDTASAKKAIDTLHRYNWKDRELVVKEDVDCERDDCGRLIPNKKDKDSRDSHRDNDRHNRSSDYDQTRQGFSSSFNTYGLSLEFLDSLNIQGPLNNRIFVANLDYKVPEKKLEEIFRLAGKVLRVRLYTDTTGTSKGFCTVEFEHPVEAVQAISMFHDQNLYGRAMSIRMDKYEIEETAEVLPTKLPTGLESIGKGLGVGGNPLSINKNFLTTQLNNLPSVNIPNQNPASALVATPQQVAAPTVVQPQVSSYNLSGLTNALGQQNVQNVALNQAANLTTPQVNQALTSLAFSNLNASSFNLNNNSNLNHLANQAQNALQNVAAAQLNSLNPSFGLTSSVGQTAGNLYSGYTERDYQNDRFRNNGSLNQATNQGQISSLSDKVLMRNIPPNISWQKLKDILEQQVGEVRNVEFRNRGMAVVQFSNYQSASRAISLKNSLQIENRTINMEYAAF